VAEIELVVNGKDEASKMLEGVRGKIDAMSKQMAIAGGVMVGAGVAITGALAMAMKAAAEEEAGIVRLSTAMGNMGIVYDEVSGSLEDWIDAQQQKTAIADSEQRDSLASLIRLTGDLTQAQDLLTLAMDVAVGTGKDLANATTLIQYAVGGNWGMLERYIPALKQAKDEEEKWMLLRELFAGQAEAFGATMEGQMQLLQHNIGDIKETIGALVSEQMAPLIATAQEWVVTVKQWVSENPALTEALTKLIGLVGIGGLAGGMTLLATVAMVKTIPALALATTTLWGFVAAQLAAVAATGYGIPIALAAAGAITLMASGIAGLAYNTQQFTEAKGLERIAVKEAGEELDAYNTQLELHHRQYEMVADAIDSATTARERELDKMREEYQLLVQIAKAQEYLMALKQEEISAQLAIFTKGVTFKPPVETAAEALERLLEEGPPGEILTPETFGMETFHGGGVVPGRRGQSVGQLSRYFSMVNLSPRECLMESQPNSETKGVSYEW
jgi:hypothetical protein